MAEAPLAVPVSGRAGSARASVGNDRSTRLTHVALSDWLHRGDTVNRLLEAVVGDGERDAHETFAARAVGAPGGDDDVGAVEDELGERGRRVALGHARPEVRSRPRRLDVEADRSQTVSHEISAPLVDL